MHAIAVLVDDSTIANEAITYFKSGGGNGAVVRDGKNKGEGIDAFMLTPRVCDRICESY